MNVRDRSGDVGPAAREDSIHSGVARGGLGGQLPPPFFKNNVIKTFVIDVR